MVTLLWSFMKSDTLYSKCVDAFLLTGGNTPSIPSVKPHKEMSVWKHAIYCNECPRFNNAARKYVKDLETARSRQSSPYSLFPI